MKSEPMPDAPGPDAPGPEILPEPSTGTDPYWEHLKKVNDVFYDQIKTADQKAAYLFTFMVAFLLASAEGRDIFSLATYRDAAPAHAVITGIMALAVLLTLFSALGVVMPRKLAKGTSLFWGAWPEGGRRLLSARQHGDRAFLFDEYARNVENLATLARRKFRLVGLAFRGLMVWLACYVLLLAVSPPA
ncbi:Pycsar system effector family protein [Paracoccus benzoatiresistens]|uniref:DUF5706 domain-containing protein n=1 Tax=Paracoccus benzoatiresistens TaxID=2997341 RepID=A0ABT4J6D0_9RHOB|nr:Pycsar system effector family protein [Paracoccus sp. EF6]MCZ0962626.1 DUF5706 domain-containing protein [Paracoccus sp. EF6]